MVSATTTNSSCASLSSQLKKFYAIIQTSTKHSTISSSILHKNFKERGSPQKPSLALILQVKKKKKTGIGIICCHLPHCNTHASNTSVFNSK